MKLLVKNIGCLLGAYDQPQGARRGASMNEVSHIYNAWLAVEDGRFVDFGSMEDWPGISDWRELQVIDAEGRWVMPGLCDSHTHLVFAASRAGEFSDRIKGMSYEEIAARGGGILNSAAKMAEASEDQLFEDAMQRLFEVIRTGTTAIETKSGYGLTKSGELKMLRVIQRIKAASPIPVKVTFLGAHAYPMEYKNNPKGYVDLMINEVLPEVAKENLADYIDVFCEQNYFSVEDTIRMMVAGKQFGMKSKIHVNQFNAIGGVAACVQHEALSVDHLEVITEEDIKALQGSSTIPVALPGCSLFIKIPYTPARSLIDADLALALATDYNPGSCPSGNMQLVMSLACIHMGMTPEEAFNAATINGAAAMELMDKTGAIVPGYRADFLMLQPLKEIAELPYFFGRNAVQEVYLEGKKFNQ